MGKSNGNEIFSISKVLPIHYFFHSCIAITKTLLKNVMNYVLPIQVMNYFNSMPQAVIAQTGPYMSILCSNNRPPPAAAPKFHELQNRKERREYETEEKSFLIQLRRIALGTYTVREWTVHWIQSTLAFPHRFLCFIGRERENLEIYINSWTYSYRTSLIVL